MMMMMLVMRKTGIETGYLVADLVCACVCGRRTS